MALTIEMNGLYSSAKRRQDRIRVKARIRAYYSQMGLQQLGVEVASVRPTGWHGESGAVRSGGHITVRFEMRSGVRVTTRHIYRR